MTQGNFAGMPTVYDPSTPIVSGSRASFASENGGLNQIPATRFDSVAAAAQKYYPAPNTPGQIPNPAFPA